MNVDPINYFLQIFSQEILNPLIILMFVVSLFVFLWGVFQYVRKADESDARKKGGSHILWGLVGMLIMTSAYTIISIALDTLLKF